MQKSIKILQAFSIPYSALASIIFGLMFLSFPIGAYLVFNSGIGDEINFDYPLKEINFFLAGISYQIPFEFELGDFFIVLWSFFLILFTIAIFGPSKDFLKVLGLSISTGLTSNKKNYMASIIQWFAVLIVVSGIINFVQLEFGITTIPPEASNNLIKFFDITLAPLIEETGFRVLLIGLPLFAIYSHKSSFRFFLKSLWLPSQNLHVSNTKKVLILITLVGIFFGVSHIISGESWSIGKATQASASGIILGWVYFRYGFVAAILIHWATNYFIFSYVFFIADINGVSAQNAFSHPLIQTIEILLVITGIISTVIIFVNFVNSRKKELKI